MDARVPRASVSTTVPDRYLSMVAVAHGHRCRGLGRALVEHIIGDDADITWVLRAGREGAVEFFNKLGFSASTDAMERKRS